MAQAQPLDEILVALSDCPSSTRKQNQAVTAILRGVVQNLRSRVDYDTAAEIANDTAHAILIRASNGYEINVGLVYGIARNLYRKHVESATATKRQVPADADCMTQHDDAPIEHREVREAVAKLPRDTGSIIILRYLQGMTVREICAREGLTPKAVRLREEKGLGQLREMLLA